MRWFSISVAKRKKTLIELIKRILIYPEIRITFSLRMGRHLTMMGLSVMRVKGFPEFPKHLVNGY